MAYAAVAFNSGGSSVKAVGYMYAAASSMRRARLMEIELGNASSPADNAFIFIIQQISGLTTIAGTTKTPAFQDQADTLASTIVCKDTITADGSLLTAGAFALNWAVNQRGSVRYVAAPGTEIVIPATASNGFLIGVSAASTTTQAASCTFLEM